jgi:hypothetical protein
LAVRLGTLHLISGADAMGSLVAGFAALGREVGKTEQGARLRTAIEAGKAGLNGDTLWSALRIGEWASAAIPSPVLEHLRNDVALLLAGDLEPILEAMPIPTQTNTESAPEPAKVTFTDYVLGVWAFSRELVQAIETIAAPTLPPSGQVLAVTQPPDFPPSVLR